MDDVGTVKAQQIVIETVLKSGLGADVDAKCMVLFGHRYVLSIAIEELQEGLALGTQSQAKL